MEPFDRRPRSAEHTASGRQTSLQVPGEGHSGGSGAPIRTPKVYQLCDTIIGGVILLMVVFTPWAFGTTRSWAIWTMTGTALFLGVLLLLKWILCLETGYRAPRWTDRTDASGAALGIRPPRDTLTWILVGLTFVVLAYTLTAAINARAVFIEWQNRFDYRDCIQWLPHSYDRAATWEIFWRFTGLACFFWATRDWLLGKGGSGRKKRRRSRDVIRTSAARMEGSSKIILETQAETESSSESALATPAFHSTAEIPKRLRLLLWVLCINGSLLALEAILQRLSGTNKLLWILEPRFNLTADSQFGPYAYRANAASYFNLLWPISLGFWLVLRQAAQRRARVGARIGTGSYLVLLPGAVLMAACPIISTARGGAIVAVVNIALTLAVILWSTRKEGLWFRIGTCSLFAIIVAFSATLGLKQLIVRFQTIFTDQMSHRKEIYENALPIAHDFPVLGTGPGTFGSVYQLYRSDFNQDWAAYCHDDWLETRITYGWVGFSLILLMLGAVAARWWKGPGMGLPWELTATLWIALAGCLLHAKFDFPMQIYSIVLLFLLQCAILFSVARRTPIG